MKGGPFRLSENPVCCKISKKLRGDPLETYKKYIFFWKNFGKKTKNEIFEQSHSAEKLERGDTLGFLKLQFAAKYQKTWKDPLATKKNFRIKVAECQKKLKESQSAKKKFLEKVSG